MVVFVSPLAFVSINIDCGRKRHGKGSCGIVMCVIER